MLKKLASDMISLSDVGSMIPPKNYSSNGSDDYVFQWEQEFYKKYNKHDYTDIFNMFIK